MNIPSLKYWMLQRLAAVALTLGVLGSSSGAKAVVSVQRETSSSYLPGISNGSEVKADEMKKKKKKKKKSRSS
jgi:hypothetical protein